LQEGDLIVMGIESVAAILGLSLSDKTMENK